MARMSGISLGNFFKLAEKMGKPVGDAVRGVGKELIESGAKQTAKNVLAGNIGGLTAEGLKSAAIVGKAGQNVGALKSLVEQQVVQHNLGHCFNCSIFRRGFRSAKCWITAFQRQKIR